MNEYYKWDELVDKAARQIDQAFLAAVSDKEIVAELTENEYDVTEFYQAVAEDVMAKIIEHVVDAKVMEITEPGRKPFVTISEMEQE